MTAVVSPPPRVPSLPMNHADRMRSCGPVPPAQMPRGSFATVSGGSVFPAYARSAQLMPCAAPGVNTRRGAGGVRPGSGVPSCSTLVTEYGSVRLPSLPKSEYAPASRIALGVEVPSGKVGSRRARLVLCRPASIARSRTFSRPKRRPAATNGGCAEVTRPSYRSGGTAACTVAVPAAGASAGAATAFSGAVSRSAAAITKGLKAEPAGTPAVSALFAKCCVASGPP